MAHSAVQDAGSDPRLLLLDARDNVMVAKARLRVGETVLVSGRQIAVSVDIPLGHKIARQDIAVGTKVLKYGAPIGSATAVIGVGDHAHTHNIKSDYTPTYSLSGENERYGEAT